MVDSCLHCKFRNGAWRPRTAFQDRVLSFEDRIIYIHIDNAANIIFNYSNSCVVHCVASILARGLYGLRNKNWIMILGLHKCEPIE